MKFRSRIVLVPGMLALLVPACAGDQDVFEADPDTYNSTAALSQDGRYIVQFKNSTARSAVMAAGARIAHDFADRNAMAVYLPDAAVDALRSNPSIDYVEVDPRRYPTSEVVPYGITLVQADQVPSSPPGGDADRVTVCIIDSGLQAGHEDFAGLPVAGTNNSSSGSWSQDLCGHGTHVAGTVAAVANNGVGVVGVAPDAARLHIVKVFGDDCSWSYSSDLVHALNVCTGAGAQVINMSLGGSFKSNFEENAFNSANNSGVLSIAAAGNDGSTRLSYPASYDAVMSVAALDANKQHAEFSQRNSQVEIAAPGVDVDSTYPYEASLSAGGGTHHGNGIEYAALGTGNGALADGARCTSTNGSWSGKVVLCERGDISFYDKVRNAQLSGATGVAIYNNEPGGFFGTLGDGNSSTIPAISLSREDGLTLVATAIGSGSSVKSGLGNGYAALDGTSMATPHVAGVAALLWAHFPAATNTQIRNAMNATAEDLGAAGRDNSYGWGLVRAKAAYDYLSGSGGEPPVCEEDGVCNPECGDADPDCEGPVCAPVGASCTVAADCCTNKCTGPNGRKTCK